MTAVLRLLSRRAEPSRRVRRILVVVAIAVIPLVLGVVEILARLDLPLGLHLIAFVLTLIAFSVPLYAIQEFRRNVFRRKNADERERQRRDDAYRLSYLIVQWGVVLVPLGGIFWDEIAAMVQPWMLIFIAWGYVAFLPYMIFAWREPDATD